jgi:hypothetical protein
VIVSGIFDLPLTYIAGLDTGMVRKNPKDSVYNNVDLWFEAVTLQEKYLELYNSASLAVVGPNTIGFNDCKDRDIRLLLRKKIGLVYVFRYFLKNLAEISYALSREIAKKDKKDQCYNYLSIHLISIFIRRIAVSF